MNNPELKTDSEKNTKYGKKMGSPREFSLICKSDFESPTEFL